jgi:hypothetical protein
MAYNEMAPLLAQDGWRHQARRLFFATPALRRRRFTALLAVLLIAVVTSCHSKPSGGELVLTAATDPGTNAFMPPAAPPPPTSTQPQPTLQQRGDNNTMETQPLPGDRDGLYGGTANNGEVDPGKVIDFLGANPNQASAFVNALNSDTTIYWSGARQLTVADIPVYLHELTPAVLRLDTRITNHGFDGRHFTTLQSVFQAGTAVLVDCHGVPRVRGLSGNPLTAPFALRGEPKLIGTAWPGYRPGALAEVTAAAAAITNFVLVDIVTGKPFNRPVGTTGSGDTPHTQAIAPPRPFTSPPPSTKGSDDGIAGTYRWHYLTYISSGQDHLAQAPDFDFPVTLEGNVLRIRGQSGPLNADGSFVLQGPNGPYDTLRIGGTFGHEGGRTVIRNGTWDDNWVHGTWTATKQ